MEKLWKCLSMDTGNDESLWGTEEEVINDLAHHHEWAEAELPDGWGLEEIAPENATARDIIRLATEDMVAAASYASCAGGEQPWGDGSSYELLSGEWLVDEGRGRGRDGWSEGYECCLCGEIYTDTVDCACEESRLPSVSRHGSQ